jgi:hypothetical protein
VVRLNPISKTDEKWNNRGGKGDKEGKNRLPSDSSAAFGVGSSSNSNGASGGHSGNSIRVPSIESASATDSAGNFMS